MKIFPGIVPSFPRKRKKRSCRLFTKIFLLHTPFQRWSRAPAWEKLPPILVRCCSMEDALLRTVLSTGALVFHLSTPLFQRIFVSHQYSGYTTAFTLFFLLSQVLSSTSRRNILPKKRTKQFIKRRILS